MRHSGIPPGLAPLGVAAFRGLWLAQLVSNMGTWMQTVGAQWLMVASPSAALLASLVQAASLLPVLALSLPAGVLADALDRRRLLVATQAFLAAAAGLLAALTWAGRAGPAMLLVLTFILGCGAALANPAWQAIQPDLVPRALIPAAAALNSANVNIARAVGPALAGGLVAWAGPAVVFALNSASFLWVVQAVWRWRPAPSPKTSQPWAPAIATGLRYVRNAPGIRRVLLRSALFILPASALWALLPVVAHAQLRTSAAGYGVALGALGLGAVVGALAVTPALRRVSATAVLAIASAAFAGGSASVALLPSLGAALPVLLFTGMGWVAVLSVLNTALQLTLPAWVRARGSAAYLMVFMGGQGVASLAWGVVATPLGADRALLLAGALAVAGAVSFAWWPLPRSIGRLDRTPHPWPDPFTTAAPAPHDGPVEVQIAYRVDPTDSAAFLHAARALAVSRRRTGATRWDLWRDVADPTVYVEQFRLPTWAEHLEQHRDRLTGYDAQLVEDVAALSADPPTVRHLVRPPGMARRERGLAIADELTDPQDTKDDAVPNDPPTGPAP